MGNKVNGLRLVCDTRPWLGSSVTNRDQATMRKDIPARHEPTQQISLCCQSGRKNSAGLSKGSLILGSGLPCRCCKAVSRPIVTCLSEVCQLSARGMPAEYQRRRPPLSTDMAAPAVVDGHVDRHGKCAKTVNLITSTRVSWEGQMVSEVSPGGNTAFL
eukprot:COSAG01_NODE_784_length_13621_cov_68.866829_14_plen_159_part_00